MSAQRIFRDYPDLGPFFLENVRPTGRELGTGSYGSVEEVEVGGVVCAAKKIHSALVQAGADPRIPEKYVEECQLMSDLRHPHIVQFLGICFLPSTALPVLVMEMLHTSLDDLLTCHALHPPLLPVPDIPLGIKRSMFLDIVRGLAFLHRCLPTPIIHRDLSAKNVLLNSSMTAKISDLGNARIVDFLPEQLARTLTRVPGTPVYMPPEAVDRNSPYGPKLDVFSFGHLALYTIIQVFPCDLLSATYTDPQSPKRVFARSELERREPYIAQLHQQLGWEYPLVKLVEDCLSNAPGERPSAEEVMHHLENLDIEDPFQNFTKLDMIRMVRQKDEDIQRISQRAREHGHVREKEEEIHRKDEEILQKTEHIAQKDREIRLLLGQLREMDHQIAVINEKQEKQVSELHGEKKRATAKEVKQRRLTDQSARIAELQARIREMEETEEQLTQACGDAVRELSTRKEEGKRQEARISELEAELGALQASYDQLQQRHDAKVQEKNDLLDQQQHVLDSKMAELAELQRAGEEFAVVRGELKKQVSDLQGERKRAMDQLREVAAKRDAMGLKLKQYKAQLQQVHTAARPEPQRVCPVCKVTFPTHVAQAVYEDHVQEHFLAQKRHDEVVAELEKQLREVAAERDAMALKLKQYNAQLQQVHTVARPEPQPVCPICHMAFPTHVAQAVYEDHVQEHFKRHEVVAELEKQVSDLHREKKQKTDELRKVAAERDAVVLKLKQYKAQLQQVHTTARPEPQRVCPICNLGFPTRITQDQYEQHVQGHFGD